MKMNIVGCRRGKKVINWTYDGVIVNIVPPKSCPPGHYSLVNTVPPDIIH